MKNIYLLLLLVPLAGCTQLLSIVSPVDQQAQLSDNKQVLLPATEQERFNQALDQLTATQSPSDLREVRQNYPQNLWGERAKTIILYVEELSLRKEQLKQLQNEQQQLQTENQQLLEKIEQLKRLLIELEQRPQ